MTEYVLGAVRRAARILGTAKRLIAFTGEVYPTAEIPRLVKRRGGLVVEIDPEPTGFTESVTDVFIQAGASEAMRELDRELVNM